MNFPPIPELEEALRHLPSGQKLKVPNKRSDVVLLRERLFMSGRATSDAFSYLDMLLDYEKQGRVEFLPEDS